MLSNLFHPQWLPLQCLLVSLLHWGGEISVCGLPCLSVTCSASPWALPFWRFVWPTGKVGLLSGVVMYPLVYNEPWLWNDWKVLELSRFSEWPKYVICFTYLILNQRLWLSPKPMPCWKIAFGRIQTAVLGGKEFPCISFPVSSTFYFEINYRLTRYCKNSTEALVYPQPCFPSGDILYSFSTISKPDVAFDTDPFNLTLSWISF